MKKNYSCSLLTKRGEETKRGEKDNRGLRGGIEVVVELTSTSEDGVGRGGLEGN